MGADLQELILKRVFLIKHLFSVFAVFLLSACQHSYTAESWEAAQAAYFKTHAQARQQAGREGFSWDPLFLRDPAVQAASDAAAGRYALYSIAMGYGAAEKDAEIFGVTCGATAVETVPLVFGCIPPGVIFFKRIFEYNAAMLTQPGFPHADACKIDEKFQVKTRDWFAYEVESINKERAENIKKWRQMEKRAYNP